MKCLTTTYVFNYTSTQMGFNPDTQSTEWSRKNCTKFDAPSFCNHLQ